MQIHVRLELAQASLRPSFYGSLVEIIRVKRNKTHFSDQSPEPTLSGKKSAALVFYDEKALFISDVSTCWRC
jgi:hypothetical protein